MTAARRSTSQPSVTEAMPTDESESTLKLLNPVSKPAQPIQRSLAAILARCPMRNPEGKMRNLTRAVALGACALVGVGAHEVEPRPIAIVHATLIDGRGG